MFHSHFVRRGTGIAAITAASALILGACAGGGEAESGDGEVTGAAPAEQEGVGPGYVVDYSEWGDAYEGTITVEDTPGKCSWEEMSKKDYSGQTLRILSHVPPVLGEPAQLHGDQFAEITGATVEVEQVPFPDIFSKSQLSFQTGVNAYDVIFGGSQWLGDFQEYYATVPDEYLNETELADSTDLVKQIAQWNGETKLYSIDADRHYMKYRTDVIDDPDAQAAYLEATGNELRVPQTWDEYNEQAAFFASEYASGNWSPAGQPADVDFYGSVEVMARDNLMFSAFISRVGPYAKHPDVTGGFWFDEDMTPQVNNPGFVRGLEDFVEAVNFVPPGYSSYGLADEIASFSKGEALFSYSWDDAYVAANQADSPIRENVAAAPLPGADEVWNRVTGEWDTPEGGVNYAPYISWGWTSVVTADSPVQQMAFDYLCFFGNKANHTIDLTIGRFGVNPARTENFDASFWTDQAGWEEQAATTYIDTLENYEENTNRVFDLRVPGNGEFYTAMANGVAEALAGQKTPQEALDDVAVEWESIIERIGPDEIEEAYQAVIRLEDNLD
jgi:multiple sugar transport system substrate-binding protein